MTKTPPEGADDLGGERLPSDRDPSDYTEPAAVIDLLVEYPRLMQRPLLVKGDQVVIGRPKERATALF